MTMLTSLYELSQLYEMSRTKDNVQKKVREIKESTKMLNLKDDSTQQELRKVALFDNCTKRRLYAIKRLNDIATLQIISKKDKNLSIRQIALERIESL